MGRLRLRIRSTVGPTLSAWVKGFLCGPLLRRISIVANIPLMDFGFYAIDTWGDPVGQGTAADPRYCTLQGVAKFNSRPPQDQAPYAVANELICGRLGLMIGLPVPPGVVVAAEDDKLAYVSLRFGPKGESPPPIIAEHIVEDHPAVSAGIIAFDCWVGNEDRHSGNLAYVWGQSQRPITVFDHSHALLGFERDRAIKRLRSRIDDPFVAGCLPPILKSSRGFGDWASRISSISSGMIRDVCEALVHPDGITADECAAAVDFLVHRKDRVLEKIEGAKGAMPNVDQWELNEAS